jgi:hypothetical protein
MEVYTHTEFEHYLSISIAANGIFQLLLDIVMEVLHIVPTRINHLSLTVLNAFLAWKTLSAIQVSERIMLSLLAHSLTHSIMYLKYECFKLQKDKFKFLHEDCQVLFLMELFLIAGDIYYLLVDEFSYQFIYARLFFIICSTYNFVAVIYIMKKYSLWSLSYQGDIVESEIVDEDRDQALSLFYRPSVLRQSEAAEMFKEAAEFRARSNTASQRVVSNPMPSPIEEGDERDSELDNHL